MTSFTVGLVSLPCGKSQCQVSEHSTVLDECLVQTGSGFRSTIQKRKKTAVLPWSIEPDECVPGLHGIKRVG